MSLFIKGDFKSHSGLPLTWKIECDSLTDEDLDALATIAIWELPLFKAVVPIPIGGNRLAEILEKCTTAISSNIIIVDDVLTTGKSMNDKKKELISYGISEDNIYGLVIFDRSKKANEEWIYSIFEHKAREGE